jgi:hypothetical protein
VAQSSESSAAGLIARFVAGAAIGPALFGGGLLRIVAVLLFGVGIGFTAAWLLHRWLPGRCSVCVDGHRKRPRARVAGAGWFNINVGR